MSQSNIKLLNEMREEVLAKQAAKFAQIIELSTNPELTATLLWSITNSTVDYNTLTEKLSEALDNAAKIPWWLGGRSR